MSESVRHSLVNELPGSPYVHWTPMTLFDSHAHFPVASSEAHGDHIARAKTAGLCGLLAVGGGPDLDDGAIEMARMYPDFVSLAMGYDRDTATTVAESALCLDASMQALRDRLCRLADEGIPVRVMGEIGLDFSRAPSASEQAAQQALFEAQLLLAGELELPCSIHSREAVDETLAIMERAGSPRLRRQGRLGVIHCFTGDKPFADAAIELGLMIGVSGILTFRNADALRGTVATLPHGRLIVETDCPYLAPVPKRGVVNEPALIVHTALKLAEVLGITPDECADETRMNAERLFGIENEKTGSVK